MREMTKTGDPMLRIKLPRALIQLLKDAAKHNTRRYQDQVIKSLARTFKYEAAYAEAFMKFLPDLKDMYQSESLEKYAQVISTEMMQALRQSADSQGIALDMEVALRLTTSMTEPALARDNSLLNRLLGKAFTSDEAVAECLRQREDWLYLYELEKLRLFLRFEKNLPREIKETFTVINVKEESKRIKAELDAEDRDQEF